MIVPVKTGIHTDLSGRFIGFPLEFIPANAGAGMIQFKVFQQTLSLPINCEF